MRFLRYDDGGLPRWGRLEAGRVTPLDGAPWSGGEADGPARPYAELDLLPPVPPGGKVLCIGRNYLAHAKELGNEVPAEPLVFLKPSTSLLPHGGTVVLPPESERVDFEGELALVIGRRSRRVSREAFADVVFGVTAAIDVSARDLQKKDGQWWRAKGFDTFCPCGPVVAAAFDAADVRLRTFLDGEVKQDSRTSRMIFDLPTLVSWVSQAMTLEPGDLLLTGTPEGVGPLAHGQLLELEIEGLERLSVRVAKER
ncbi:MAG: fumarylacetoacetate hydrolase family protein [Thermoanaerobaculia bacterium]|jgi:2-keto-4-pentenoate hydratase/2-oxohepta-3-ene-1,7-dioic acid hydratase in catechol pathway|nr:fumarylacetoacetate hydrolase family protein [Thermoanaerobaculia bacterium]